MTSARDAIAALAHASTTQRAALRHLLERTGGGGLVDRPRIAVTDALTGALLALTDARELRVHGTCTSGRAAAARSGLHARHDRAAGTGSARTEPDLSPGARSRPVRPRPRASMSPTRLPQPSASRPSWTITSLAEATSAGNLTGFYEPSREAPGLRLALRPVVRRNPHRSHAQQPHGINGTAALLRSPVHRRRCSVARRTRRIPFDRDDGSHELDAPEVAAAAEQEDVTEVPDDARSRHPRSCRGARPVRLRLLRARPAADQRRSVRRADGRAQGAGGRAPRSAAPGSPSQEGQRRLHGHVRASRAPRADAEPRQRLLQRRAGRLGGPRRAGGGTEPASCAS